MDLQKLLDSRSLNEVPNKIGNTERLFFVQAWWWDWANDSYLTEVTRPVDIVGYI